MFNKNAFKTSLLFLGIILIAIVFRMFMSGHSLLVNNETDKQTVSTICSFGSSYC